MANVPTPSRFLAGGLTQERPVVELRVDLTLVLDRRTDLIEWKLRGWAASPTEVAALRVLEKASRTVQLPGDASVLERFVHLLQEYCEPF